MARALAVLALVAPTFVLTSGVTGHARPEPVSPGLQTVPLAPVAAADPRRTAAERAGAAAPAGEVVAATTVERTRPFQLVAVTWDAPATPDGLQVRVRFRAADAWSDWFTLEAEEDHAPDGAELDGARGGSEPLTVPRSDGVEAEVVLPAGAAPPEGLRLDLVDPGQSGFDRDAGRSGGAAAYAVGARPDVLSRAQWGADEGLRSGPVEYGSIQAGFVHHTVNANDYSPEAVPGIIRSIYAYHVQSRGWRDIGYNFLVDRFGRMWEGRAGGIELPVIGAHTSGFNGSAFAMSAIGTYTGVPPTEAQLDAYARVFSWKLGLAGVDPLGQVQLGGTTLWTVSGHRDAGSTDCPGQRLYDRLPDIRALTASMMGTSLLAPRTTRDTWSWGDPGGMRVTATLARDAQWDFVVRGCSGAVVASIGGNGRLVDVAWDGGTVGGYVRPGRYVLSITARSGASTDAWHRVLTVSPAAGAPPAACGDPSAPAAYVKAPASDEVYVVDTTGRATYVGWAAYVAAGYPAVTVVQSVPGTTYVRAPWSASLYATQPSRRTTWLSGERWAASGWPAPANGAVPGTGYARTPSSASVYGYLPDGSVHVLSYADFAAVGLPAVQVSPAVPGSRYVRTVSSPVVYAIAPDGQTRTLTYDEFLRLGPPRVEVVPG